MQLKIEGLTDMQSGRSAITNGKIKRKPHPQHYAPTQREMVCSVLFTLALDAQAPAAARTAAARALLDEWNRRGEGEKTVSAMTLAEIEDEAGAGEKAGER